MALNQVRSRTIEMSSYVFMCDFFLSEFQFPVKNHVEIGEKLDILDFR